MNINDAIHCLEQHIKDPRIGLPEEVFVFISLHTPMICVDLLIKDEKGRLLLSWRDDFYDNGWHLPGGIIRYKERFETRIKKVAETEVGTEVKYDPVPLAINEFIREEKTIARGHFISFLYNCFLPSDFIPNNKKLKKTDQGYLEWHKTCPPNLINSHKSFKKFM